MRENKGNSSIVLLIVSIIIVIGAAIFWMYSQGMFDKKEDVKVESKTANQVANQIQKPEPIDDEEDEDLDEDEEERIDPKVLEKWVGKYVDEEDKDTITIYANSKSTVSFIISVTDGEMTGYTNLTGTIDESGNKIVYEENEEDEDGKEYKHELELSLENEAITIKGSSTDPNSVYNKMNGTYKKTEDKDSIFSGVYKNDDYEIILAYNFDKEMIISIDDYWERYTKDFDDKEIKYDSEFFDDKEKLIIEKTADGIKITEASSTSKDKDEVLNKIKGIELKKVVD